MKSCVVFFIPSNAIIAIFSQVVKQLWNHIRGNNLQDPSNRRNILCDESLKALFRVDSINMFQMNKALSKHIWPLESNDGVLL